MCRRKGALGSIESKMGLRGGCSACFVKAKGGCFKSKNHRPKGRVGDQLLKWQREMAGSVLGWERGFSFFLTKRRGCRFFSGFSKGRRR